MEKKKILILAGGGFVVCMVVLCVVVLLIWLFNQEDNNTEDEESTTTKRGSTSTSTSTTRRRGSTSTSTSISEDDGEEVDVEESSRLQYSVGWTTCSPACSADFQGTQSFFILNGSPGATALDPGTNTNRINGATRTCRVPACATPCRGTWSGWSPSCSASTCGTRQSNTFTVTQQNSMAGVGGSCEEVYGVDVTGVQNRLEATKTITRDCNDTGKACVITPRPCVASWNREPCSNVCGAGTTWETYEVTDYGVDASGNRACPYDDGFIRNITSCNNGSCCNKGLYTSWQLERTQDGQPSTVCEPQGPGTTPVTAWTRGIKTDYLNRMGADNACVITNRVTTNTSSEGCPSRRPTSGSCNQPGYTWNRDLGCVRDEDVRTTRITGCRRYTTRAVSCSSISSSTWRKKNPTYSYTVSADGSTCDRIVTCDLYDYSCGAKGGCRDIDKGTSSAFEGTDYNAAIAWDCPSGWRQSSTPGMCTPIASRADTVGNACPNLFNQYNPSTHYCEATARHSDAKPSDTYNGPNNPPLSSTQLPNVRDGRVTSIYNVSINRINGVRTRRITVNYVSSFDFEIRNAYVMITAEFPGYGLSNPSQSMIVNLTPGGGSFTADTHVSTWDMYENKSITIYDSSGLTPLSNTREF